VELTDSQIWAWASLRAEAVDRMKPQSQKHGPGSVTMQITRKKKRSALAKAKERSGGSNG
jgi:hypothetical protein